MKVKKITIKGKLNMSTFINVDIDDNVHESVSCTVDKSDYNFTQLFAGGIDFYTFNDSYVFSIPSNMIFGIDF